MALLFRYTMVRNGVTSVIKMSNCHKDLVQPQITTFNCKVQVQFERIPRNLTRLVENTSQQFRKISSRVRITHAGSWQSVNCVLLDLWLGGREYVICSHATSSSP